MVAAREKRYSPPPADGGRVVTEEHRRCEAAGGEVEDRLLGPRQQHLVDRGLGAQMLPGGHPVLRGT